MDADIQKLQYSMTFKMYITINDPLENNIELRLIFLMAVNNKHKWKVLHLCNKSIYKQ